VANNKNASATCVVEPEIFPFKVGLCSMVEAVRIVYKLGLRRALMMYIMEIGLLGHRTYMLAEMDALVGIRGMVAEEVWEVDWTPSQRLGRPGEALAAQKPICLICQGWPVHSSLEIGFTSAAWSCETSAWPADGGTSDQTSSGALCGLEAGGTFAEGSDRPTGA